MLVSPDGFASPGFDYGKQPHVPRILGLMKYFLPRRLLRANLAMAYADPTRFSAGTVVRYHDFMLAADYLRLLPDATLVALPSAGHVPHEESPDDSLQPLMRFLLD